MENNQLQFRDSFKNRHFERNDSWGKIILIYLLLLLMCVVTVYPMLNVLSVALRPADNLFQLNLQIVPDNYTLENFRRAIFEIDLLRWIRNSLIISVMTATIAVCFSASAGYAFSRYRFRGRKAGMMMFLVTQMFPGPMLLLPMYILLVKLGLVNQFLGLLVPYTATAVPFSVWMLKGYFDTIPKSLEESAYIDGASPFMTFYRIILPLAKPALAITFLFGFMSAWSEYIVAKVILTKPEVLTLPVGLVSMQGQFNTQWGVYSAAALITSIPVVVLFISLSRYLVGGLTLGGVKG